VVPVLAVVALVAVVAGAAVAGAAWLWPHTDPAAPSGRSVAAAASEPSETGADLRAAVGSEGVTILGLSAAAVAVVTCTALFGVLLVIVRTETGFAQLDLGPARWAARSATSASTSVLRLLTHLGSTAFAIPLALAVAAVEAHRRSNRAIPAFLVLVEGGQLLLVNLVKVLVGRARPDIDQLAGVSSNSFPSGHTATAAATFAALALLLGRARSRTTRAALAGAAAGLTAAVAATRVLLGVHWLTDVLAGAALGWGWAGVCSIAFGGRLLRFGAAVEQPAVAAAAPEPGT
jgi:undecaprenyl-diphosphatase